MPLINRTCSPLYFLQVTICEGHFNYSQNISWNISKINILNLWWTSKLQLFQKMWRICQSAQSGNYHLWSSQHKCTTSERHFFRSLCVLLLNSPIMEFGQIHSILKVVKTTFFYALIIRIHLHLSWNCFWVSSKVLILNSYQQIRWLNEFRLWVAKQVKR